MGEVRLLGMDHGLFAPEDCYAALINSLRYKLSKFKGDGRIFGVLQMLGIYYADPIRFMDREEVDIVQLSKTPKEWHKH